MYGDHEYDAIYDIGENRDFEDHDDFFVSITQYIMMMVTRMGVAGFTYANFNYHLFYLLPVSKTVGLSSSLLVNEPKHSPMTLRVQSVLFSRL